ncbi:PqqD family peptide modification chaperone [Paraflavisolibacter sp. H34]|uniref:PqqD family peptide modification chaperone n=1 Tax=Huijunlia imazamoxiresistens TaxID=3127457 RepID=UPI003016147E
MSELIYKRNEGILANEVGGEMVMMSIEDGKYFGLNRTGSYIWNLLEEPSSLQKICAKLSDTFRIPSDQTFKEVAPFVEELLKEKIIIPC